MNLVSVPAHSCILVGCAIPPLSSPAPFTSAPFFSATVHLSVLSVYAQEIKVSMVDLIVCIQTLPSGQLPGQDACAIHSHGESFRPGAFFAVSVPATLPASRRTS
jgi:hypothetical protein